MESNILADYILQNFKTKPGMSVLELCKVMYLIDVEYFKTFGKPLLDESFIVYDMGPIEMKTYIRFRHYGVNSLDIPEEKAKLELNMQEMQLVNNIIDKLNWGMTDYILEKCGSYIMSYIKF